LSHKLSKMSCSNITTQKTMRRKEACTRSYNFVKR